MQAKAKRQIIVELMFFILFFTTVKKPQPLAFTTTCSCPIIIFIVLKRVRYGKIKYFIMQ